MTLKELVSRVNGVKDEGQVPKAATLQLRGEEVLVREVSTVSGIETIITVYESGMVLYQEVDRSTVFHISDAINGEFIYDTTDENISSEKSRTVNVSDYMDADWRVRLIMYGNDRITHNRLKTDSDHIEYHFSGIADDIPDLGYTPNLLSGFEKVLNLAREQHIIDRAKRKMTDSQWNIYFHIEALGMNQHEVARLLGISPQYVNRAYKRACKLIRDARQELLKEYYED